MIKQGRFIWILLILSILLTGCLSGVWTGANLVYDRHNVYKKLNDYHLLVDTNNSLFRDKAFKCPWCVLDITVFNGDILVAGHLPSTELINKARKRLLQVEGYRHIYIELAVSQTPSNGVHDAWITTKIRSQIFADDSIDPNSFRIVTSDSVVYLMGDVKENQAEKVINISRYSGGVVRVVKLMNYYTYSPSSRLNVA
jgi:osmotically-inducible protein OsmY